MLLKNATIIDGLNNPAYQGHILIQGERIVKIFSLEDGVDLPDEEMIDCTNKMVTPGFIDAHTHNDFFAGKDNNMLFFEPFIKQGVTTMIAGNCGFSAAGYLEGSDYSHLVGGGLFTNDGRDYHSFQQWSSLVHQHMPVNLVSLVGHGTARIGVNGKSPSPLTDEQMTQMLSSIEQALLEGAAGVSFGLMYEPGQYAPIEELEEICKLVKKHNKIVTFHARACSKVSTSYQPPIGGRAHNLRAMDEVLSIMRKTGVRTQYSHLIFVGKQSWSTVEESLQLLEEAKKEGFEIGFDMYPMEFGASVITVVLPAWYLGMPKEKRKTLITKVRLWLEIFVATKALGFGFKDMLVSNTFGKLKELEGLRVTEIAKKWKKSAFQTYLELIEKTNGKINVLMYQYQNKDIIEKLRLHPQSIYMSDAWIEQESGVQNFACYYAFPKFMTLARDHQTSLEAAIYKMTGLSAARFQIKERGSLEVGQYADVVIFDLNKLSFEEGKDVSPQGIEYVINNGKIIVNNNEVIHPIAAQIGRMIQI
jgi:N-acyl-D-amino-acid deacylase